RPGPGSLLATTLRPTSGQFPRSRAVAQTIALSLARRRGVASRRAAPPALASTAVGHVAVAWRIPSCGVTLLARFWAPGRDPVTLAPGRGTMGIATLASWLLTAAIGAYMLRTWIVRGGPRMRRAAGDRLPPIVVYGHAGLALTGLAVWISYVVSGLAALAWCGACMLMPVIGLGAAMVTVWTPYPVLGAGSSG